MDELVRANLAKYQTTEVPATNMPKGVTALRRTYLLAGPLARPQPDAATAPADPQSAESVHSADDCFHL